MDSQPALTFPAIARTRAPRKARVLLLVAAVTVLGLAAFAAAGWELLRSAPPVQPTLVVVVAAIVLVGDVSLLRIRFGANGNSFNWAEASLIVGALVGGWPLLVAVGVVTIFLHQLLIRRQLRKCLFAAGTFAVGVLLARLAFGAVTGSWSAVPDRDLSLLGAAGLAAGATVSFLWISIAVVLAVAWSQGLPVREVWAKGASLRLLVSLGNITAGVAAVLIGDWSSPTLLVLPFFLLAAYYVYRNYLNAQEERERWQELQGATLELQQVDPGEVAAAVQRGAEALFGADCTLLLLADDPQAAAATPALLALGLSVTSPIVVNAKDSASDSSTSLRRELELFGVVEGVMAPLIGVGKGGVLLVGFSGPAHLTPRELQVISTFANHASVSMQRARLFDQIDEQRGRLSAVIDNASDGVVLVSADGVVASWNPGMTRLTGRTEADVLDQPLDHAFTGRCADGTEFTIADALERLDQTDSPDHLTLDIALRTADGSIREASLSLSAVRAPSGRCEYAVLVARDITAKREVQQAKQDFIATVSHELRTPLTPIKGYLSLFLRPDFHMDDAKRRVIFGQMLDRANQLERLVEDLLSTSRMEHGEFSLRPEPTDVDRVVARAAEDLALASGRPITSYTRGVAIPALSDPARLQQVIANLLSNADKYSPQGKPVIVRVAYLPDNVEVSVQDFGAGIPEEQQGEVFEPFRRLGDHLTRKTRGCGLGLHIARRLVESMDGRIWLESRLGYGSTFYVSVPVAAPAQTDEPLIEEPATLKAVG